MAEDNKALEPFLNKIFNEDCLEGMKRIPDKSVDLVLTDVPYAEVNRESNGLRSLNKAHADVLNFDLQRFMVEISRICRGSVYIFCGFNQVSELREILVNQKFSTRIGVWEKTNPSPMNGKSIWLSGVELCVYGKRAGATFNEHCKSPVWRFPVGRSKLHPTEKNQKLFEHLITASSKPGDIVFDPCIGSGTTAAAAKATCRQFFGFELNPESWQIAVNRVECKEVL